MFLIPSGPRARFINGLKLQKLQRMWSESSLVEVDISNKYFSQILELHLYPCDLKLLWPLSNFFYFFSGNFIHVCNMSGKMCVSPQAQRLCHLFLNVHAQTPTNIRNTQRVCRSCSSLLNRHILQTGFQHQFRLKSSSSTRLNVASANMADGKRAEQAESVQRELYQSSVGQQEGWLVVGPYKVFAWSVSGIESCIVIKSEDMTLVFDMGIAVAESVRVPNVFIT